MPISILCLVFSLQLMKQQKTVRMYSPDAQDLILKAVDLGNKKVYVAAM